MDSPPDLAVLERFVRFTNDYRLIRRTFLVRGRSDSDNENDAEHSFQMALFSWFVNDHYKLGLDTAKILRYALVHDLVEVYAGDTPSVGHASRHHGLGNKEDREAAALERIRKEWEKEFPDLLTALDGYTAKRDPESKLVYALDKILPSLSTLEDGGRDWREHRITLQELITYGDPRIVVSPPVAALWEGVKAKLKANAHLFSTSEEDVV